MLPKIKPRYYSVCKDPFYDEDKKEFKKETDLIKICFSLH